MPMSQSVSACSTASSPERYRWFVRLCIAAIALIVLPAALLQGLTLAISGFGNPYRGVLTLIHLVTSFVAWQAAMVFLCLSGREIVARRVKEIALLNALYVLAMTAAVSLFYLVPARSS
jgi:hypothetical protein